jgi:hypothetical protein
MLNPLHQDYETCRRSSRSLEESNCTGVDEDLSRKHSPSPSHTVVSTPTTSRTGDERGYEPIERQVCVTTEPTAVLRLRDDIVKSKLNEKKSN